MNMSINKLSVAKRLSIIAGTGLAITLAIGAFSITQLNSANEVEVSLVEDALPSMQIINSINDDMNNLRENELNYVIAKNNTQLEKEEKSAQEYRASVDKKVQEYAKRIDNDEERKAFSNLTRQLALYSAEHGKTLAGAKASLGNENEELAVQARDVSGRTFDDLTRVEAHGNSTARVNYSTLDRSPLTGISYYRLRQVDKDGTTAHSNVATVRFDGSAGVPALLAYPNPATGNGFRLAASNLAPTTGTVRVFDNVGRLVFAQTVAAGVAEAIVQPAQALASGMYYATWTTTGGVKLTTKVSVE